MQLYSPKHNLTGVPYYQRLNINYAFFTTQSNYLVVAYLFCVVFLKQSYNKKPPFGIELAITVYITVTMLVFWFGLLASRDEMSAYNAINWISTVMLHAIIPCLMIVQFILSSGDYYHGMRTHARFGMIGISMYPLFYLIYSVIRGEFRFQEYGPSFFSKVYSYNSVTNTFIADWNKVTGGGFGVYVGPNMQPFTSQMWYPYWFFNLHKYDLVAFDEFGNPHIWASSQFSMGLMIFFFISACIIITTLVISLQFFYIAINNNKFYRWHDINENLLTKAEHDYRMALQRQNRYQKYKSERMWLSYKELRHKFLNKT
ncbi:Pr6Pr family membrane protein [Spiroplasma clarkii]|uniref:Pr6Pr family membrane protein n=1 Tax=Spiroplasma clarkii TaxID=2139 RepID=UPI0011BAB822|nr:Pr6Pr family membrane protein [Spiroplasma clarkii]